MVTYKVTGTRKESGTYCNIVTGLRDHAIATQCVLVAIRSGEFYDIRIERE